jgi:multiple sugar transport system permease protein
MAVTEIRKHAVGDEGGMGYLQSLPRRVVTILLPLLVFVFVLLFPFYWMAVTSLKPNEQMTNFNDYSPFWVVSPTLEHFYYLLFQTSYPGWLWNTILISVASTALSLLAAVFAAYAIERLRFSGSRQVGLAIFLAYLVPPSILFIPLSVMVFRLGLYDTPFALILTYPTFPCRSAHGS